MAENDKESANEVKFEPSEDRDIEVHHDIPPYRFVIRTKFSELDKVLDDFKFVDQILQKKGIEVKAASFIQTVTSTQQFNDFTRRIASRLGFAESKDLAKLNSILNLDEENLPELLVDISKMDAHVGGVILLFSFEVGLRQKPVSYQNFERAYDNSNFKIIVGNAMNSMKSNGWIGRKGKDVILTERGFAAAVKELKSLI